MPSPDSEKRQKVQSILVIHQGALGDFILALPSLKVLRQSYPEARSVIMGYPRILELADKRFYADEILPIDQKGMASFFVRGGTLNPGLCEFLKSFDLVVVFGKDGEGILVGNLRRICHGEILHINTFPAWDEKIHLTDHLLRQFSRHGLTGSDCIPRLHLDKSDRAWGERFWKQKGVAPRERAKVIVLHPGSGSKKKVWPLERFSELAGYLQRHLGSRILIVVGPAEGKEVLKTFEERAWDMGSATPILANEFSLLQLASVMEGCGLFIGNDSGISHLAAALGLPTIAIFGPTDPAVWAPRGETVVTVRKKVACSPCPQERFFLCQNFECLRAIETGDVVKGLKTLIGGA